ncbi:iron uptake system protein EfeO [Labrys wisconsinensis]|uniref:Iron uptake system component EfeO n=1 Tax=Labrys wisconsinensis TaxID=425677 RepID=A0ABU0JEH6_9HYPH|nr:iron uptake system protein EfeO [Labrys wisconsinensis]MDQ0472683.1 iron uptake system component EfeO [Labrys wisconsinensis]
MSLQSSIRIGVGVVIVLAVAVSGLGVYAYFVKSRMRGEAADGGVPVAVTATACEPDALTAEAGRVDFAVTNRSERALEWEILDGVMVKEERENIAPGFTVKVGARLEPGTYAITCGLLGNPRGTLTVVAPRNKPVQAERPSLVQFIGPMAEYKVYVTTEGEALLAAVKALADAVGAGDLAAAQALYAPAHGRYEHIKPVAEMFGDLDAAVDAQAGNYAGGVGDPAFSGFHRLEYGLFERRSLDGLAPVAARLVADADALQAQAVGASVLPQKMAGGAASLLQRVAAGASAPPLSDIAASVEGAAEVASLFQPLTAKADQALGARIDAGFAALERDLAQHRPDGSLTDGERAGLRDRAAALAEDMGKLRDALGLD